MATTRVLATALPYSLDPHVSHHLTVFITHRLTPDSPGATLADFPAAAAWVSTLTAGRLDLVTDSAPHGIPTTVVSTPQQASWDAVFPGETPVNGFPAPSVSGPWISYPAHSMDGHAVDMHLGSALASPLSPPGVHGNPVADAVLDVYEDRHPGVRELRELGDRRVERDAEILQRKLSEAAASIGQRGSTRDRGYPSEPLQWTSAVEVLLRNRAGDERFTRFLDSLLARDDLGDPVLVAMRDVHAARRFYQRETRAYRESPDPNSPPSPRPAVPVQDFHERAAQLGSTPVVLRPLGLAIDVALESRGLRALSRARWVSARFTPAPADDVVRLAPPRTWCVAGRRHFHAVSSGAWSGGVLPLGDPDAYTVLELDPDASALKLEQHVRDLPRALASDLNGDRASGAPASLRSTGFAIAKIDREDALRAQVERAESFPAADDDGTAQGPDLAYDDIVRGIRLEVWDDVSTIWRSVHERRVDVTAGGVPVLADEPDTGFQQLTGLTRVPDASADYHLHEVFVGWDGWSLSAPRPGKVIVHGDGVNGPAGEELVLDEPPDPPASHVHVRSRVEPGTLPWLRYGRSYSFRVRGVDLAGNSVPRPAAEVNRAARRRRTVAARAQLERLRSAYAERDAQGVLSRVREGVLRSLPDTRSNESSSILDLLADVTDDLSAAQERAVEEGFLGHEDVRLPPEAVTGEPDVDALLRRRVVDEASRGRARRDDAVRRGVSVALARLARSRTQWRVRPNLDVEAELFASIDDTTHPIEPAPLPSDFPGRLRTVPLPPADVPVVTTPRPFLRWHPVPPPTLVARRPLGPGESLQRLVVRDGMAAERHVVPPKATQLEAELHGEFDDAIGSTDTTTQDRALAIALKERGTLLDEWIPSITNPNALLHQDGIALHARPGADPAAAVTLDDIAADRDTPLGEGQYVVHDTDQLVLPYLPDPLADGISLVFYDAGPPHALLVPRVLQTVVLPFDGDWPLVEPLRLVVEPDTELRARRDGNRIVIGLPAGEQVRVAMSSSLPEGELEVLGLWRSHLASAAGDDPGDRAARALLARAAGNGWFWWLTPSHDLRLVHAVRQPVRPPELAALKVLVRPPDLTVVALVGVVDVHGPSTERLVVEASWDEWVDDLAADGPVRVHREDVVVSAEVQTRQRYGLLHLVDAVLGGQGGSEPVVSHRAIQTFPDTHHRRVTYTPRGLTRYSEFFDASDLPTPTDPALAGEPKELTVASSARPAAPEVVEVVPLLLWEEETEPDQPFALRRTRRSGARLWLSRPWYSSGDGELLAVVLSPSGDVAPTLSSRWGKDPVEVTGALPNITVPPLVRPLDLTLNLAAGEVVEERSGRPVTTPVTSRVVDAAGAPEVLLLGYRPEYHPGRKQWFVDVAMDPGESLWPFVRLAVARYQPDSLPGRDLSPVVIADWTQPLPERVATASRRTDETVRLTVTGPVGLTRRGRSRGSTAAPSADTLLRASREVYATVQEAPGAGGADLDWISHNRERLPLVGVQGLNVTWSAEVGLPEAVPVATPGTSARYRVLVEEYEYFDADPTRGPKEGPPSTAPRLVYADFIAL